MSREARLKTTQVKKEANLCPKAGRRGTITQISYQ
jgi:hypothetical protein